MKPHQIQLQIEGVDRFELEQIKEIIAAVLTVGGFNGVKNGSTILMFDSLGLFQKVRLDYYPWSRKHITPNNVERKNML